MGPLPLVADCTRFPFVSLALSTMPTDPEIPDRGYTTSDVAQVPAPRRPGFARRNWGKLVLLLLIGGPLLIFAVWTAVAMSFTYSSGERVGYVQKIGKKGWLCKTWEGELQMSNIPGSAPILFDFTVRGDSIAAAIQAAEGKQVSLAYKQHVGIPLSCIGETEYFVVGVRVVNPQPGFSYPPAAPVPIPPSSQPPPTPPPGG